MNITINKSDKEIRISVGKCVFGESCDGFEIITSLNVENKWKTSSTLCLSGFITRLLPNKHCNSFATSTEAITASLQQLEQYFHNNNYRCCKSKHLLDIINKLKVIYHKPRTISLFDEDTMDEMAQQSRKTDLIDYI